MGLLALAPNGQALGGGRSRAGGRKARGYEELRQEEAGGLPRDWEEKRRCAKDENHNPLREAYDMRRDEKD